MNEPKLRFKIDDGSEFSDWEEKKLSSLMSFKNGINASGDKFGSGKKCISVMDILNNHYLTYEIIRGEVDVDETTLQNFKVEYGDAVFQRSSENVQDAGRANVYMDKDRLATFSGFVIRGKRIENYNPIFMNATLNTFGVRKQIMRKAQGAQHINVGQEILSSVIVNIPSLPEQQKIADFLSTIDTVIEKQKATVEVWKERKKGVMQKLFSQEARFKADDGSEFPDWEEKKLGEVMKVKDIKQIPSENVPLMAFIAYQGVTEKGDRYDRSFLVKSEKKKYKRTDFNDFIYSSNNLDVGSIGLNKYGSAVISVVYEIFTFKENYIPDCMNLLIQQPRVMSEIIRYRQGCLYGQYKIHAKDFLNVLVSVPCLAEQQKISDCLSSLDDVIEKQKATLAAWEEMKKGLLQQMFV